MKICHIFDCYTNFIENINENYFCIITVISKKIDQSYVNVWELVRGHGPWGRLRALSHVTARQGSALRLSRTCICTWISGKSKTTHWQSSVSTTYNPLFNYFPSENNWKVVIFGQKLKNKTSWDVSRIIMKFLFEPRIMLDETVSKSTQRWKSILYTKGPLFESFFAKAEFWPITQIFFHIFWEIK